MPATLGHIGVHVLLTRGILRGADPKWILLGCVIPDLPWIAQRIVLAATDLSPLAMRSYAIGQSSLMFSLLACIAFAQFSRRPRRTFAILGFGVLLHLLLDATQIKWGNGVVLFAPFQWSALRFDLFWPEDRPSVGLLGLGLAVSIWLLARPASDLRDLRWPGWPARAGVIICLAGYLALPTYFADTVRRADLHFVSTVAERQLRVGKPIEIDRNPVQWEGGTAQLVAWFGETVTLSGEVPAVDARMSLKGTFSSPDEILVDAAHVHPTGLRDHASILGLLVVLLVWGRAAWTAARRP